MKSAKRIGLIGRVLGSIALTMSLANLGGCAYIFGPADGIRNRGSLLNLCANECRKQAGWRASVSLYSTDDLLRVHEIDANGESGWIPAIECDDCYPSLNSYSSAKK